VTTPAAPKLPPFHRMFHRFMGCWKVTEHLPVQGYTRLVRQRCTICHDTRVQELPPPDRRGAKS
jgi:hypothetical protein